MKRLMAVSMALLWCGVSMFGAATAGPDESRSWSPRLAAQYMDGRMAWWAAWPSAARDHGTFCVSCHTALPYALARASLRTALDESAPAPQELALVDNVLRRVRMWRDVAPFYPDQTRGLPKTSESRGTESVLNVAVLSARDARNGVLTDDSRAAFAHMWELQMKTGEFAGAWPWLTFQLEPWEGRNSAYFGAAMAAIAVGAAPGGYASSPEIAENVKQLRSHLTTHAEEQHLLNRVFLLLASTKLPGLLTREQSDAIIAAVVARQQSDGGWATSDLGTSWKRVDGTPLDSQSDGYATGLVTFVLEQLAASESAPSPAQRGLQWLRGHQDKETGRWFATSLNKQRAPNGAASQFMDDAATGYAVLALSQAH